MLVSWRARQKLVLIALLIAGAGLRLHFAERLVGYDEDYATAALMSKHIAEGRERPLYFYGYPYISAVGAYVGAAFVAIFGVSLTSLSAAMLPFSSLWIVATYLLFRRLVNEWAGVIAAAVVALPPPFVTWYSAVPLIGYPPTLAFGTLILYFGVRLNDRDLTPRGQWLCLLGLGALAGLAIWTHLLCLPYLVVGFGLLVAHVVRSGVSRGLLVKLGLGLVLFLVTLLPVIVTARTRGLTAMFWHWPSKLAYAPGNFRAVVSWYIPNQLLAIGRMPPSVNRLVGAAYAVLGAGFIGGFAVAALKRRAAPLRAALVPVVFVVAFLLSFLPNAMARTLYPRFFTPFYLAIAACFAFPLAYRRTWLSAATAALAAAVIAFNVTAALRLAGGPLAHDIKHKDAQIRALVARIEAEGFRHVLVDGFHAQALTLAARERVIFAVVHNERYYPYAVEVAAHDHAALLKADAGLPDLPATLRALGITTFASFHEPGLGATVFHHMVLPADELRLVEPVGASLVGPSGVATDAAALFDRNDETTTGDRFDAASALIIDFGRPTRLCAARFVAPHPADYPAGYTLLGSADTRDWTEIQHVEDREPQACIHGNRICYRNRHAVMECRFEPTELRYLKIQDFRSAGVHFDAKRFPYKVWRFNEAYFYERTGDGTRPDALEAAGIARELTQRGVELAICDQWLSRKIETAPAPRPAVWPRYEYAHPRSHVERLVPIRPGVAVVVETAHAPELERLLADATLGEVAFDTHDFAHYTACIVQKTPVDYAAFPGLRWNGLTLTGTARIATADWYHRRGVRLDQAGHTDKAMRCFERSFETFPGIRANLERLAPHDEKAAEVLAALTPQKNARCRFPHGVSLVGYTLTPSPLRPGRPATLRLVWELDGPVKHDFMQVFVHFVAGDRRLFQADHNAVFPVAAGAAVPPALVLDEHTFTVPPDAPPGQVTIRLGATAVSDRTRRLKPRTKLRTHHRAVEIGRTKIAR